MERHTINPFHGQQTKSNIISLPYKLLSAQRLDELGFRLLRRIIHLRDTLRQANRLQSLKIQAMK